MESGKGSVAIASDETRDELLNYQEAARFLRVSRGTLENWISTGLYDVPHVRVGRLIRFRLSSLRRWVLSREKNTDQLEPRIQGKPTEHLTPVTSP